MSQLQIIPRAERIDIEYVGVGAPRHVGEIRRIAFALYAADLREDPNMLLLPSDLRQIADWMDEQAATDAAAALESA